VLHGSFSFVGAEAKKRVDDSNSGSILDVKSKSGITKRKISLLTKNETEVRERKTSVHFDSSSFVLSVSCLACHDAKHSRVVEESRSHQDQQSGRRRARIPSLVCCRCGQKVEGSQVESPKKRFFLLHFFF
jgi:TusA-related sulfurtransferase